MVLVGEAEASNAGVQLAEESGRTFIEKGAELIHLDPQKAAEELDERLRELTGMRLHEETPQPYAKDVKVPTLMTQLRRDLLIHAEADGQSI